MTAGGQPLATALLIDDDKALLDSWTRFAGAEGFEVVVAASWDEGLSMFQTFSPDLVIADYNLPGSAHGLALLATIRALRPTVRLVLISGVVEPSDLARAQELGVADRVLSKGDSAGALEVVIEELQRSIDAARDQTDWVAFAQAHRSASSIDPEALSDLDNLLSASVEGSGD